MCGIIAVLRRPSRGTVPPAGPLIDALDEAVADVGWAPAALGQGDAGPATLERLAAAADPPRRGRLGAAGHAPESPACWPRPGRWPPPTRSAAGPPSWRTAIRTARRPGSTRARCPGRPAELEAVNAALVRLKDATWAIGRDRVRAARAIADLIGPARPWPAGQRSDAPTGHGAAEPRGRPRRLLGHPDRAVVPRPPRGPGPGLGRAARARRRPRPRPDRSRRPRRCSAPGPATRCSPRWRCGRPLGHLSFVYKAAAEIGELGDNTRALRAAIRGDAAARTGPSADPDARCTVLGHTRWASVGVISQANAHPLNSEEVGRRRRPLRHRRPQRRRRQLPRPAGGRAACSIPAEITTDAKVIPTLVSRRLAEGVDLDEAFRSTVASFDGSVAIGGQHRRRRPTGCTWPCGAAARPCTSAWPRTPSSWPASPTGWSRRPPTYLRMDGETTHGQIVVLDRSGRGHPRRADAGSATTAPPCPSSRREVRTAEITTRDIDRAGFPHFLLKEISEAPGVVPQDAAGQDRGRRAHRAARRPARRRDAARRRAASGWRSAPSRGSWSSARAPPRWPARASPPPSPTASRRRRCPIPVTVSAMLATELSGFGAGRRHDRHPGRRRQPVGHDDRHQPHRRPGPGPGRPWSSPSSTGATATWSTSPTACSTPPTAATSR